MSELTPYFQDGKLHLPESTFDLLAKAGLNQDVIASVRHGLSFDDRSRAAEIRAAMEQFIQRLATNMGTLAVAS